METQESVGVLEQKYSRRTFIKGVIATGATASSTGYLFRGSPVGAATFQTATERLITLNVKLDTISNAITEAKHNGIEAKAMARENTAKISELRSGMLSADDVQRMISQLEYRVTQLESGRRR